MTVLDIQFTGYLQGIFMKNTLFYRKSCYCKACNTPLLFKIPYSKSRELFYINREFATIIFDFHFQSIIL